MLEWPEEVGGLLPLYRRSAEFCDYYYIDFRVNQSDT